MSAPAEAQRDRVHAQWFRNVVAALVVGGIITVLAGSYLLLLPGAQGVASALCSFGFLAVAFVAWEYLMKPGYGFLHRRSDPDPEEAPPEPPRARKQPRSPRAP